MTSTDTVSPAPTESVHDTVSPLSPPGGSSSAAGDAVTASPEIAATRIDATETVSRDTSASGTVSPTTGGPTTVGSDAGGTDSDGPAGPDGVADPAGRVTRAGTRRTILRPRRNHRPLVSSHLGDDSGMSTVEYATDS